MATRNQVKDRIILKNGTALNVTILDGILPDDVLISGMKAEGYRVMTGEDVFPVQSRRVKDFLVRIGVLS